MNILPAAETCLRFRLLPKAHPSSSRSGRLYKTFRMARHAVTEKSQQPSEIQKQAGLSAWQITKIPFPSLFPATGSSEPMENWSVTVADLILRKNCWLWNRDKIILAWKIKNCQPAYPFLMLLTGKVRGKHLGLCLQSETWCWHHVFPITNRKISVTHTLSLINT